MFDKVNLSSLFDFVDTSTIQPAITALEALNKEYSALSRNLTNNSKKIAKSSEEVTKALIANEEALKRLNITTEAGRASVVSVTVAVGDQVRAHNANAQALKGVKQVQDSVKGSLNELTQRLKAQRDEFAKLSKEEANDTKQLFELARAIQATISDMDGLKKAARGVNSEFNAVANSYNNLDQQNKQLIARLKQMSGGMDKNSQEAKELQGQIAANTAKLKEFDNAIGQGFRSVGNYAEGIIGTVNALKKQQKELQAQREALTNALGATKKNSAEHDNLQKELNETNSKLAQTNQQLRSYGAATEEASNKQGVMQRNFRSFVTSTALAYFSLQALQRVLQEVFAVNVEYSDALVAVQKTTGLAASETEEFVDALKSIPTRTSLSGLLEIAKVGGQLGIAKKDILGFTTSVDVAVQALSDDFEGGAEAIANALGKINSIFKISKDVGIDEALLNIGSAINELAASGVATAPFLADYARRVGAIASNAGLALGPVLAYGAALEELGFTSEVAGTATNRLISGLATKPKEFFAIAKLADSNLTLKEFKNRINTDFKGAMDLFMAGLNKGGTSTTAFAALIKSLGLKSGEAVSVLTSLARNVELVEGRLVTANRELDHGNSLAKEAELRTNNLAGSYEQLKNKLINLVTNNKVTGFFKQLVDFANQGILKDTDTKPVRNLAKEITDTAVAARKAQNEAALLVIQIEALDKAMQSEGISNMSSEQAQATFSGALRDRSKLVAQLTDLYGENVLAIDKVTGQYTINSSAVRQNIGVNEKAYDQARIDISKQLKLTEELIRKKSELLKAGNTNQQARRDIAEQLGITPEAVQRIYDYIKAKEEFDNRNVVAEQLTPGVAMINMVMDPFRLSKPEEATDKNIAAVKKLSEASKQNAQTERELADAQNTRAFIIKNLIKFGLDYDSAMRIANETQKKVLADTKDLAEEEGKAAKAKHDLLHAQYELNKARAEARAQNYERQSSNVANEEEVRNRALIKATKERQYIAQLDRNEGVRLSKERNKEILNGEAIFNVERATLTVQLNAALKKLGHDRNKEQLDLINGLRDAAANVDKLVLQREIVLLEQVQNNELLSYEERTKAAKEAAEKRIAIAEYERDQKIRAAKGEKYAIEAARQEFTSRKTEIENPKGEVKPFDAAKANDTAEQMKLQRLIDLEDKYEEIRKGKRAADLSDTRAYEKEKYAIEQEFLNNAIGNDELELGRTKDVLDRKLQMQRDANSKTLAMQQEHYAQLGELLNMSLQTMGDLYNGFADIQTQRRQNELTQMEDQKNNEVQIAGDNEKAKSRIQNEFDAKQRKLKREQAKQDKINALFNIALNTAMAVTSVLSTGGGTRYADFGISAGILSAIVIAQGAIQAGLVLAKPLPAYWRGTKNAPGGPALVGDRGAELVEKDGKYSYFDKPTVVNLKKGSIVHTASETKRIIQDLETRTVTTELANSYIASESSLRSQQATQLAGLSAQELSTALAPQFGSVVQAIHSQEQVAINFTKEGIEFQVRKANQWTTYENHRYYRGKRK